MAKRILVIPEFNEARTIISVLDRAYPLVDEIIVVDDGSTDQSGALVHQWAADHPAVRLLTHRENQGFSGAVLTGLCETVRAFLAGELSGDDLVISIDADGQHLPEEIPDAVMALHARKVDVLLTCRDLSGYPRFKRVGNWGLSLWASLLSGYRYHDVECGFRVMRVAVVADLIRYFTGRRYGGCQEIGVITARRGWKVDNRFPCHIAYYRPGARLRDGITNAAMGLLAFLRVVFRIRHDPAGRVAAVLRDVDYGAHNPPGLKTWSGSS